MDKDFNGSFLGIDTVGVLGGGLLWICTGFLFLRMAVVLSLASCFLKPTDRLVEFQETGNCPTAPSF